MQPQENRKQRKTEGTAPALSLRELYYRGVFEQKLFSVEDVLMDIHNREINAEISARNGETDASNYADLLSELEDAKRYFHAGAAAAWFEDEGFLKDGEGHICEVDGEPVIPLQVEKIRQSMKAFRQLMKKEETVADSEIPLREVYAAGVFRYGDFMVEEAAVDVHNRLTDAYLDLDAETERLELSGDYVPGALSLAFFRERISELKEAKAWADGELVKLHFLMADAAKDVYGRFLTYNGRPVIPIDDKKLRKEYEEYLQMAARQRRLKDGNASDAETG